MMWWGNGLGWGWPIFGGLAMLVFWGGLIVLAVLAFRAFSNPGSRQFTGSGQSSTTTSQDALEILKGRYARGELTKAEYETMRGDLRV